MRVVIAPDKFKGSLEAPEVAEAVADGLAAALPTAGKARWPPHWLRGTNRGRSR